MDNLQDNKYKEALLKIKAIRDEKAWLNCRCGFDIKCTSCLIGDILRKVLE